jgi:hypothetical protein
MRAVEQPQGRNRGGGDRRGGDEAGIPVLKPIAEHGRYDLAFDLGHRIVCVQCKWGSRKGDVICINLVTYRWSGRGSVRTTYAAGDRRRCRLLRRARSRLPLAVDKVAGMKTLNLRVGPLGVLNARR